MLKVVLSLRLHETRAGGLTESGHAVQKKSTESPAAKVALAPAAVSPPSLQVISPVVKSAIGPFPSKDRTIRMGVGVVYGSL